MRPATTIAGAPSILNFLLWEAGGGLLLGILTGYFAYRAMRLIDDYAVEVLITLALATATYTFAQNLHVSGPLSVVAAGLLIGDRGPRDAMSDRTQDYVFGPWTLIDEILNSVVLVVEDEMLVAFMIEDALVDLGCEVVGPASKVGKALQLINDAHIDVAILDVTIRDEKVYPVAEELISRAVPFVLASGYGDWALPDYLRDRPRLTKPFSMQELGDQIRVLCSEVSNA